MTLIVQMQGVLKDWPSVIDTKSQELVARTYGPNAEEMAGVFAAAPEVADAARALLAALRGVQTLGYLDTASTAMKDTVKDAVAKAEAAGL